MKHPDELDYTEFSNFRWRLIFYHVLLAVSYMWLFSGDELPKQAATYFTTMSPRTFTFLAWVGFVVAIIGCIKEVFRSFHISRDYEILKKRSQAEIEEYHKNELGEK